MKKFFGIFFISILVLGFNLQAASAATPTMLYKLYWDIGDIHYYTTSDAQSRYGTAISNAAKNWYYPGWTNPLSPATRTTVQSDSAIDFHTYSVKDGYNGKTELRLFGSTDVYNGDVTSWDWAKISLNNYYLSGKSPSSTYVQGVAAHEMGHAFGLKDYNSNPNSIMCTEGYGRAVYTVQKVDNDAFNLKY